MYIPMESVTLIKTPATTPGMLSGNVTFQKMRSGLAPIILGAKGGVLTSAALLPDYWAKVQALAENGQVAEALATQGRLNPLMDALFAEQFPESVRRAFAMIGMPIGRSQPPIGALSEATEQRLSAALRHLESAGVLRPYH